MVKTDSIKLSPKGEESEDKPKQENYGCLSYRPSKLQCMNNIRCHVIWQCVFNFFDGFIVNGVINVVLVTLEKRYLLKSSESGLIASSNDFGAIICSVLAGYFGEQRHKPRLMGMGILIMVLGCFIFSLPHFVGDKYQYTVSQDHQLNDTDNMCIPGTNDSDLCNTRAVQVKRDSSTTYYALLLLGNILLGIGSSPLFTIGLSYIDENCKQSYTAFYLSWTFCAAAVGTAAGYAIGGQTLSLFVDINTVDPASVSLSPSDPQWVGAWWIAPLIAMAGFLFVTMPICGYPRRLPNYAEVQKERKIEAHGGEDELMAQVNFGKSWKDFPKSIWLLITNPTYMFICCGAAADALIIGGMVSFGAKIMHEKFNVDIIWAGTMMGIITIPGSGGGMLLGGYLVKRFGLKCRGIIRMCAGFMLAAFCLGPLMLTQCSSHPLIGIDRSYVDEHPSSGLKAKCNMDCGCSTQAFEPLCIADRTYFSPCHAGCISSQTIDGAKGYSNCSCISSFDGSKIFNTNTTSNNITQGSCAGWCPWFGFFCVILFVLMILTFATMSPAVTALFRCVPDKQRSVGIGVNLLFVRLVGTTPGPILLGYILDSTCTIWQDTCGQQGSCWVYDKSQMGLRIMFWFMILKICGFLLFLVASIVYKPPPYEDNETKVEFVPEPMEDEQSIKYCDSL